MTDARFSRVDPRAGHARRSEYGTCRECGKPDIGARCTFCSDACVDAWKLRSQPSYAAKLVLKRDAGVCLLCGLDCVDLLDRLWKLLARQRWAERSKLAPIGCEPLHFETEGDGCFALEIKAYGLKGQRARLRRRLWEMDHVVPVAEGGGSCGLDNLRTLCWRCHARESAALRQRLLARRKGAT